MPGVVRIFTAADVPGSRGTGLNDPDQPVFVAEGEVTCCVADFLAMVVADTQFHARQAAKNVTIDYEVLEPITDPFDALKPDAAAGSFGGHVQSETVEHPPAGHRLLARRRRCRAGDGRARHRRDVPHAADRDRVPRAGSVSRRPAGKRRPGSHRQPGIGVRPPADREGAEAGSEGRRDRAAPERRRVRRERGAVDPGADGARRAAAAAAGEDRADAQAVDPAPREASRDDDGAHGWRPTPRGICSRSGPASWPMRAAITRRAPNARFAPRATRAACTGCRTSTSKPRPSTPTIPTPGRCADSAATRSSSRWKA